MAAPRAYGSGSATTMRMDLPMGLRATLRHACQSNFCMRGMNNVRKKGKISSALAGDIGSPWLTKTPVYALGTPVSSSALAASESGSGCLRMESHTKTVQCNPFGQP
eukprot:1315021-Pleurochrysis_carterae.AAC.2